MSTTTLPAGEYRARFTDLVAAEWIKLRSLRSTYAVFAAGALVSIGICANSARSNVHLIANSARPDEQRAALDPLHAAFVPEAYQVLMLVAASVGAIVIFGEYSSGMIRTTFAAVPARRAVVAAKALVVAALMLVYGAVAAAGTFGLTQAIYAQEGIGLSIGAPGAFRAVAGAALLAVVAAMVGMALGALVRHPAGTVVAAVGVLILLPRLFEGDTYRWVAETGNAMPYSAWAALVENPAHSMGPGGPMGAADPYPVSITEAWLVYGAWTLVAVVIAVVVVHRRDV
ncbi:ABC transporter permease [Spirillospora sp. NPDC029432]|uniref:ABC transporter permease subunit n=1 Tax=Spirillospora sp. NPDC029432 TaxID=3154599 RepID=UPI003451481A